MLGMLMGLLFVAFVTHAIGVGAINASGRPTGKRVWITVLITLAVGAGIWALALLGRAPAQSCMGDCGLLGLKQGLVYFSILAGILLGSLTMAIHGKISVQRFSRKYGPPIARQT